jgi:hypothetical protein
MQQARFKTSAKKVPTDKALRQQQAQQALQERDADAQRELQRWD